MILPPSLSFNPSIEQKIGELFIVGFSGDQNSEEAKIFIEEIGVGGFIYYDWANDLSSRKKVSDLSAGLQRKARERGAELPLLLSADREGGLVTRGSGDFTSFPGNGALGHIDDVTLTEENAFLLGKETVAVGINLNWAPVVDIRSGKNSPFMDVRSFGDTTEKVIRHAKAALIGYKRAGLLTCMKHWPGHGEAQDSHEALPILHKTREELRKKEFLPFLTLSPYADSIMTAHMKVPALDPSDCATLSPILLTEAHTILGTEKPVVSDSLTMKGVLPEGTDLREVALKALTTGCDILLFGEKGLLQGSVHRTVSPEEIREIQRYLVKAVKEGTLPEQRVNEAFARVRNLKKKIPLSYPDFKEDEANRVAEITAKRALTLQINHPLPDLRTQNILLISPSILQATIEKTFSREKRLTSSFYPGLSPEESFLSSLFTEADRADILLFCAYNACKNPGQAEMLRTLSALGKPLIVLVTRDPEDIALADHADMTLQTFSPSLSSIQAAYEILYNENK